MTKAEPAGACLVHACATTTGNWTVARIRELRLCSCVALTTVGEAASPDWAVLVAVSLPLKAPSLTAGND